MEHTNQIVQATHGSIDRPLRIGNIEIPCYVLEDGRRVIVQQGLLKALDMSPGGASKSKEGNRLTKFFSGKSVNPFVTPDLVATINSPILFRLPKGGTARGFEATILA